jgi:hypothetical protein
MRPPMACHDSLAQGTQANSRTLAMSPGTGNHRRACPPRAPTQSCPHNNHRWQGDQMEMRGCWGCQTRQASKASPRSLPETPRVRVGRTKRSQPRWVAMARGRHGGRVPHHTLFSAPASHYGHAAGTAVTVTVHLLQGEFYHKADWTWQHTGYARGRLYLSCTA